MTSIIIGTGSCIPDLEIQNSNFLEIEFFESNGARVAKQNDTIIDKFSEITGIKARRYAGDDQLASDLAYVAAKRTIDNARIDKETLDYIIVAHNFGDVACKTNRVNIVPTLASKVKAMLAIANPDCVAYDLPFGCPGWVEGFIQANYFIRSGDARRCLVIAAETLSRVIDKHDRDSMIFGDGAAAIVLEASPDGLRGVLSHKTQTHALEHVSLLSMGSSNNPKHETSSDLFLKMNGKKVYEFALTNVPLVVKAALDKAGIHLRDIHKILIHQANEKMDHAIAERLFKLYDMAVIPHNIMPMTIGFLGNSSVATVPTMLDLILKGELGDHTIKEGDRVVFASVGAGMNINALVYQF
jgi:3-oxoacyl-[acyl-carrier-protein] synthase III